MLALVQAGTGKIGIHVPAHPVGTRRHFIPQAILLAVPLTTYRQPCNDIGQAAVDAIVHRIEHPDAAPRRTMLQGFLIIRASSR
jgi:DNA-binding LacI/PurR family transcriptional regulator